MGDVTERRHRGDHRRRHPLADQPAARGFDVVAAAQGVLRKVETLVEAVAAPDEVLFVGVGVRVRIAVGWVTLADRVDPAQIERVDSEAFREHVHRGFDAEHDLPEAIPAEGAGGNVVRVDDLSVELPGAAAIDRGRLGERVEQDAARVVAVGAGVAEEVDLHRGELAALGGPEGDGDPHRMPHRCPHEFVRARELVAHGATGPKDGECDEILGEDLLFAAEAAADACGEHPNPVGWEVEEAGQLVASEEGHLGRGADDQATVVIDPADRAVRFELCVAHSLGLPRPFDHDRACRERGGGVAGAVVKGRDHIALGVVDAIDGSAVGVKEWRSGLAGLFGVEDGGKDVIGDADEAACGIRYLGGLRDDRGHALADMAHDVVEHTGVVRVVFAVLVPAGGVAGGRHLCVGEDRDNPREGASLSDVDGGDAGVCVRRSEHAENQRGCRGRVRGV